MASVRKHHWVHKGVKKEKWAVDYTDNMGKRRLKLFERKKEADAYRAEVTVQIRRGEYLDPKAAPSVEKVCEAYIQYMRERLAAGSVGRGYVDGIEMAIRISIVPSLGLIRMNQLDYPRMGEFMRFMREDQELSNKTIQERKRLLGSIEAFAHRRGMTNKRFCLEARGEFPVGKSEPIRVPTKAEMVALLEAVEMKRKGRHLRTMRFVRLKVVLAAFCALRYGEICGLKVDNCDFENGILRIRNSVTLHGEVKGPKTSAGVRDIPMPTYVADLINEWLQYHWVPNDKNLLLTTPNGASVNSPAWHRDYWHPILKAAGLLEEKGGDNLHFHALRHFAGSWWIESGMHIPLVSRLIGHSDPGVTMKVYARDLQTMDERQKAMTSASSALRNLTSRKNDAKTDPKMLLSFN